MSHSEYHILIMSTKTTIYLSDSDDDFIRFLKKEAVMNILFGDLYLGRMKTQIMDSITSELNKHKKKVKEIAKKECCDQFTTYKSNVLPNFIKVEISNQLPGILSNDHKFQELCRNHQAQLIRVLQTTVDDLIGKIVSDPKHEILVKTHVDAMYKKCADTITNINAKFVEQLTNNSIIFDEQSQQIMAKVNQDMGNLREKLSRLGQLEKQVELAEKTNHKLFSQIIGCGIGILVLGVGVIFGVIAG